MEYKNIDRIKEMEEILNNGTKIMDSLLKAYDDFIEYEPKLKKFIDYYDNGGYREDFLADEQGLLPADLKRGVLTEDLPYDLVSQYDYIKNELLKLKK